MEGAHPHPPRHRRPALGIVDEEGPSRHARISPGLPHRELTWSGAVHPPAHSCAQYRGCLRGNLIAGPGNELVGADEHVFPLIALTAAGAPIADDLERDLQLIGSGGECAANCLLSVEAQERKSPPQPLKDVAPRGERLRREMVSRARPERLGATCAAAPPGRSPDNR